MTHFHLVFAAGLLAALQNVPVINPGGIESIGPKQDDPLTCDEGGASDGRVLAIGPKQDDPRSPIGALARPGDDNDPKASGGGGGVLAIGPKQDDPRSPIGVLARPGDDNDP